MDEWSKNKEQICMIIDKMKKNRQRWFGHVMCEARGNKKQKVMKMNVQGKN